MDNSFLLAGRPIEDEIFNLYEVVLEVMKERKGRGERRIRGRDLWSDVSKKIERFSSLFFPPQNGSEAGQTADAVMSVKKLTLFVSAINDSLHEVLSYLTSIKSPGWGLLSLPDEILGTIIELTVMRDEPNLVALSLSHVCRKFREIALHLPRIWTYVSCSVHGVDIARLYAERSNHAGLVVIANDEQDEPDSDGCYYPDPFDARACHRFLQAIIPYCDEWCGFAYNDTHLQHLEMRSSLKLHGLEHLRVDGDSTRVFEQYDIPFVKTARFEGCIPQRPFSSTITHLSVRLFEYLNMSDCIVSILEFLKAIPLVTELRLGLIFRFIPRSDTNNVSEMSIHPVILENVVTFKLDVDFTATFRGIDRFHGVVSDTPDHALEFLVKSIQLPMLSHMDLRTTFGDFSGTSRKDSFISALLPDPAIHSKLACLRLTATFTDDGGEWGFHEREPQVPRPDYYENCNITLILDARAIPFVTSFSLSTHFDFRFTYDETQTFSLRRLELDKCWRITGEFLEDIYLRLVHDDSWEAFEVVVQNCPEISAAAAGLNTTLLEKTHFVTVVFKYNDLEQKERKILGTGGDVPRGHVGSKEQLNKLMIDDLIA